MEQILKMAINFRKALEALGTFSGGKMWEVALDQKLYSSLSNQMHAELSGPHRNEQDCN